MNYVCLMFAAPALCAVFILLHRLVQVLKSEPVSTIILDRTAVVKSLLSKAAGAGLCVLLCVGWGQAQIFNVTSTHTEELKPTHGNCSKESCFVRLHTAEGYVVKDSETIIRYTLSCEDLWMFDSERKTTVFNCWQLDAGEAYVFGKITDFNTDLEHMRYTVVDSKVEPKYPPFGTPLGRKP